jgi:hypothetical protein
MTLRVEECDMRKFAVLALVAAALVGSALSWAKDETPKPPTPQKEHGWLKQLAGEWETECEMVMEPGKPSVKKKGTESTRVLGAFWAVSEYKGDFMGTPFTGLMTVGYDSEGKKFIGTWVCSMCDRMCKYEGEADGKTLTLNTEGPNPATGKLVKMKDVIELKGNDHKVMTSSMQTEDGKWVTFMTLNAKRKK